MIIWNSFLQISCDVFGILRGDEWEKERKKRRRRKKEKEEE